jgi:hypothetical protein
MYLLSAVRFLGRIWRFIQKAARWLLQDFYALLLSDYQHANGVHQHCGGADYAAPAIHGLQLRSMFCCRNTAYLATLTDCYIRRFYQSLCSCGMAVLDPKYFCFVYVNSKYE